MRQRILILSSVMALCVAVITVAWSPFARRLRVRRAYTEVMSTATIYLPDSDEGRAIAHDLVPLLIATPQMALRECAKSDAVGVLSVDGTNRRIASWNGLLEAAQASHDSAARQYVEAHLQSGHAYSDESQNASSILRDVE